MHGYFTRVHTLCIFLFLVSVIPSLGSQTSENNARLRNVLKKFPDADFNKDGVLTLREASDFRAKIIPRSTKNKNPLPINVSGEASNEEVIKGLNGLYMGHSFFKPAAYEMLKIIPETNIIDHTSYIVMQGGRGGSPKLLWDNESNRKKGQVYLDTGKVDLLAMTYYSASDSSIKDYAKWFDYAISKNPEIQFMIAIPWPRAPHDIAPNILVEADKRTTDLFESIIQPLRKKYPQNKVLFCPYGLAMYELIDRLKEGKLPGVKYVLNPDEKNRAQSKLKKEQLVNDKTGHGGDLITRLSALIWIQTIYGCDLTNVKASRINELPEIDLAQVTAKLGKKIGPYNATYSIE